MSNLIATMDQLEREAQMIDEILQEEISEDAEACIRRGNELTAYLARTGKMLADMKWHKDQAMKSSTIKELSEHGAAPPSILKPLIESACTRENFLFTWIERLHRTCGHQIDWLRTVVSLAKEERRLSVGVSGKASRSEDDQVHF